MCIHDLIVRLCKNICSCCKMNNKSNDTEILGDTIINNIQRYAII